MQRALLLFLFLICFINCNADYEKMSLPAMIQQSDLIVECRISKVLDDNIYIEVISVLKDNSKGIDLTGKKLAVNKFINWTCAVRWDKYEIGQTQIMFLSKGFATNGLSAMGAGNEGEMPIKDSFCYYKTSNSASKKEAAFFEINNGRIYGLEFKLTDVKEGIAAFITNPKAFSQNIKKTSSKQLLSKPFTRQIMYEM